MPGVPPAGLGTPAGEGRKPQLGFPCLLVCLTEIWKPFSFSLGQYQAMAGRMISVKPKTAPRLVYAGELHSEAPAECFCVQCKSEKTGPLNLFVRLDFKPHQNV